MSSFQIRCLLQVSKKLTWGQQMAENARHFKTIQQRLKWNDIRSVTWLDMKQINSKRKPYLNMVQKCRRVLWTKTHLNGLFQSGKVFCGQTSPNLTFLLVIRDAVFSRLKRRETVQPSAFTSRLWWYGELACFRNYECWKVYKGFRTSAALQTMSISGKSLCVSAGQWKTRSCSCYNSMAPSEESPGAELTCQQSRSFTYKHLVHH